MPDAIEPGTTERSLVELLLAHGPATRLELQARLGVSRPTLSAAVKHLLDRGLVQEQGTAAYGTGRNGRPQTLLAPNKAVGAAVGIELGKAQVAVTILAMDGSVLAQKVTSSSPKLSLQRRLSTALVSLRTFISSSVLNPVSVLGIGLGIAGRHQTEMPDAGTGPAGPPGMKLDKLRDLIPAPILWDNNTRMAALRYIGDSDADSPATGILYVVLSSGVSAGILEGGQVFRGRGAAGELGHICIDPIGPVCSCGAKGCLEAHVGVEAAVRCARSNGLAVDGLDALAGLAQSGDFAALAVSRQVGRSLGIGLSNAVMLIDPQRIVLTGPLVSLGPSLVEAAVEELTARRGAANLLVPDVIALEGSRFDSSHGAAWCALQRWGADFLDSMRPRV